MAEPLASESAGIAQRKQLEMVQAVHSILTFQEHIFNLQRDALADLCGRHQRLCNTLCSTHARAQAEQEQMAGLIQSIQQNMGTQ